jgi:hypothetical protein
MESDGDLERFLAARRRLDAAQAPRARETKAVGEIIPECAFISEIRRQYDLRDVYDAWLGVVGEQAAHCAITGVRRGTLSVVVDSASCLHELANFRKREIIAGLKTRSGCEKIHDIEFRLGRLERT